MKDPFERFRKQCNNLDEYFLVRSMLNRASTDTGLLLELAMVILQELEKELEKDKS